MSVHLDSAISDLDFLVPTDPFDRLKELEAKLQNLEDTLTKKSFYERSFQDLTLLAKHAIPATVNLNVTGGYQTMYSNSSVSGQWGGSGFLVSSDGLVVTNYHVIEGACRVDAVFNAAKETFSAKILGVDPETDLALLKIEGQDFPTLSLGDSDALEVGERVVAIGNPHYLKDIFTLGVLSGRDPGPWPAGPIAQLTEFLISDAVTNPGNSGGPMLNKKGEVVGVVNGGVIGGGLTYSIPSKTLKFVMEQLLEDGFVSRSYLGVKWRYIDSDFAQDLGFGEIEGMLALDIEKGSPAEKAGLQRGDFLLKANGNTFESVYEFRRTLAMATRPGEECLLSLVREGNPLDLKVVLGSEVRDEGVSSEKTDELGLFVADLNAERAESYGYDFGQKGVMISKLEIDSPADKAGLWASDVITGVVLNLNAQIQISCLDDLEEALELAQDQKVIVLKVRRANRAGEMLVVLKKN